MSNSLWPLGLQHTRLPCPSPTPRVYLNSCPSSQWCHPPMSSFVVPFSSRLQSFPASASFPMIQLFVSGVEVLELQLQHQSFQWIFRIEFLSDWLVWSLCSPKVSQESSPILQLKTSLLQCSAVFMAQLSQPYITTGKTITMPIWTLFGKVMSLLFNMLL